MSKYKYTEILPYAAGFSLAYTHNFTTLHKEGSYARLAYVVRTIGSCACVK